MCVSKPRWAIFGLTLATLALVACDGDSSDGTSTAPPVETTTSNPESSMTTDSTAVPATTSPTVRPDPVEGWGRLDVDTQVFGGVTPVDGAARDGLLVLVGCPTEDLGLFPIWWTGDGFDFRQATGPEVERPQDVRCVEDVVSTPFGWFAGGRGPLLRSTDGASWEIVDIPAILGYEETFQLGYADNLFVSPDGTRLTVLYRRAAEAESTLSTLVTTTDGETWVENAHPSQALFDSSGIVAVIEGGEGLLAAGSSRAGSSCRPPLCSPHRMGSGGDE